VTGETYGADHSYGSSSSFIVDSFEIFWRGAAGGTIYRSLDFEIGSKPDIMRFFGISLEGQVMIL
jgi:hypothetical protein